MGIRSTMPKVPSIALGSAELSVIEMAKAYTSFANNGVPSEPYFIEKITDKKGKIIWQHKPHAFSCLRGLQLLLNALDIVVKLFQLAIPNLGYTFVIALAFGPIGLVVQSFNLQLEIGRAHV